VETKTNASAHLVSSKSKNTVKALQREPGKQWRKERICERDDCVFTVKFYG